ncbi:MAG: LamG domain-containing protein, partial [Syntrophomonadaceae bacterium]|nr:LamG domain-containing protein [Syntrophomonadaceae bacterium]
DDGQTWVDVPDANYFNIAQSKAPYEYNTIVDFNDVVAKSVRITAFSKHSSSFKSYGLAEVRFTYIPVYARIPTPADGAQNVAFGTTFKWRKGREALTHKFYIGTDKDAVTNGTAASVTLNESSHIPNLSLGNTYYWRVDEINTNMDPSIWQGDVWTLTVPSTILVEGFESRYGNDTSTNAVFLTWKDGAELNDSSNGSYMGRKDAPFLHTINHSGGHSAPMKYDNQSYSYSEVIAETSKLAIGPDWYKGNPGALVIWFMSDANDVNEPATDRLYVKIGSTKKVYNGPDSHIRRTVWTKWEVPLAGVSLGNVDKITIGVEKIGSSGGIGTIYLDDIMLTPASPSQSAPVNPGTTGLLAKYSMENNVQDSSGNGLNGTLSGTANGGLTYVDGLAGYGKALVFDGNNDCVDLGKLEAFNFEGSFSISLWAKMDAWSTNWGNVMISNRGETTGGGWQIRRYTNNNICFTTRGVSNDDVNTNFHAAIREWTNITCVYDADAHTKSIYINGVLDRTVNLTGTVTKVTATTTKTYIGTRSNSGNTGVDAGNYFRGTLDQILIYTRALSAGEAAFLGDPTP